MAKRHRLPQSAKQLESLKYEVAKDLKLDKDIELKGWREMPTRDIGKIGGNMVRRMIKEYEKNWLNKF
ncbi:alpha/beta-type small acid-soluble spore protein [Natranaerofaba carboxydovora]|uniref:alpha/beta-type small acid-soluble spore protein n=1 Tax=Natranaerofaba carboxydovora TaxID=2742683 RepID=UPI001F144B60|nr:alpha/beta-type small acid-soluble spore protein [Natranaerofaba carboxydovora]UMZ74015.1 Small, acid-soluble spore protein, alpha/beta type [Natranaerofaba carboxydovora]